MITSDKQIYLQETEIKPNRYACVVLICTSIIVLLCWVVTEVGIFRVGLREMRIGSILTLAISVAPVIAILINKDNLVNPKIKYIVIIAASMYTFTISIVLTFHTTIMLLFPIMFAMLYRSKEVGTIAVVSSLVCTLICPVIGYLLGTWDIPLFEELILIGTDGGVVTISGGGNPQSWLNIGKIVLYLSFPRLLMVGSCSVLLFYNIKIGVDHVNNQILLNKLSHNDNLTGWFNQNYYKEFTKFISDVKEDNNIAVLFFDVNGLKSVNDIKGHEYGDLLLKRCAQSLSVFEVAGKSAIFRAGGDEFVVFADDVDDNWINEKLSQWESRLRTINEENMLEFDALDCSMAVGYEIGRASEIEEVIRKADAFMYRNKARMKAEFVKQ